MYKFAHEDRAEGLANVRQSWICLVIIAMLVISQILVDKVFGRGWGLVAAILAFPLWFFIRPWQFGLLSTKSRRKIMAQGVGFLIALLVVAILAYYRL